MKQFFPQVLKDMLIKYLKGNKINYDIIMNLYFKPVIYSKVV